MADKVHKQAKKKSKVTKAVNKTKQEASAATEDSAREKQPENVDIVKMLQNAHQVFQSKLKLIPEDQNAVSAASMHSDVQITKPTPVRPLEDRTSAFRIIGPATVRQLEGCASVKEEEDTGHVDRKHKVELPPSSAMNLLDSLMSSGAMMVEEVERRRRHDFGRLDVIMEDVREDALVQASSAASSTTASECVQSQNLFSSALPLLNATGGGDVESKVTSQDIPKSKSEKPIQLLTPGDFDSRLSCPTTLRERACSAVNKICPDLLLTPEAFSTPAYPASSLHRVKQEDLPEQNSRKQSVASTSSSAGVNPLTKQQLQQALIHLLTTDEQFLSHVHRSYLASFLQQLTDVSSTSSAPSQK